MLNFDDPIEEAADYQTDIFYIFLCNISMTPGSLSASDKYKGELPSTIREVT